jgi:TetR/AcrR family transcriptional regulator
MSESRRRGEATREAILTAAEANFAEHGFDGARIDTIAEASSYNKTLIFRYFGDKLGLYTEVLKRADREMSELIARLFAPLLEDETIVSDAHRFRGFLTTTFAAFFDYMVEHPHFTRMINWEQAEGWQTFARIASQFETYDLARLEELFSRAQRAGLLRHDLDVVVVILLIVQTCWSTLPTLPLYQSFLAGRGFSSATSLSYLREQIIAFLVFGVMNGSEENKL